MPAHLRYPGPELVSLVGSATAGKAGAAGVTLDPASAVCLKCDREFEGQLCADGITSNVWADLPLVQVRGWGADSRRGCQGVWLSTARLSMALDSEEHVLRCGRGLCLRCRVMVLVVGHPEPSDRHPPSPPPPTHTP